MKTVLTGTGSRRIRSAARIMSGVSFRVANRSQTARLPTRIASAAASIKIDNMPFLRPPSRPDERPYAEIHAVTDQAP